VYWVLFGSISINSMALRAKSKSEVRYDPSVGVTIQLLNLQLGNRNYNSKSDSTPDIVPALLAEPVALKFAG